MNSQRLSACWWLLPVFGFAAAWTATRQAATPRPPAARTTTVDRPHSEITHRGKAAAARFAQRGKQFPADIPASPREAFQHPSQYHRMIALDRYLEHATPAEFAAAHASVRELNPQTNAALLAFFFRRWAQIDPESALTAAVPDGPHQKTVLMAWGEHDPGAALARLANLKLENREQIIATIRGLTLPKPGEVPPEEFVRRLLADREGMRGTNAMSKRALDLFKDWAARDPEAAFKAAQAIPAETDFSLHEMTMRIAFDRYLAWDSAAAARWLATLPDGREKSAREAQYVSALIDGNRVREAREYAFAVPEGAARRDVMGTIVQTLAGKDEPAARAFIASLSASDFPRLGTLSPYFFRKWLVKEPQTATDLLLSHLPPHPTDDDRRTLLRSVAYVDDDRTRSELALKFPGEWREPMLKDSLVRWTLADPAAAAAWANEISDRETRDFTLKYIAGARTAQGVEGVTAWIDSLPAGSGKSAAIEGFTAAIISARPDDALAWLRAVPDESDRLARLRRIWDGWSDREAAARWARESPELANAERAALLR